MATTVELPDLQQLKSKYLEERDKRLRKDGLRQYAAVDLNHGAYARDPFSTEMRDRGAVERDVEVLVIGAGHAGLLTAASLLEEGIGNFLIIEKAADYGGTWYWNRYPDCRCDIESYIYMPLLEDGGDMPTEKYARSREIRANAARLGRKLGLYEKSLLSTGVTSLKWDKAGATWQVETDRGDHIRARFVCLGSGPMSRPKLPGVPGIDRFKGKMFHSSRWDYDYTGGDETGGLIGLADKRVAIVGTGATACQIIPRLADSAGQLYVVQRTPAAVSDRRNQPTDPAWWDRLNGQWWDERATNFSGITVGQTNGVDLVDDTWTEMFSAFNTAETEYAESAAKLGVTPAEIADHVIMEQIRRKIGERVHDKATAEALKPWYNLFCKRPLFLDGYYETFNRANVTLLDSKGSGIEAIDEQSITVDGKSYPVDCIIFASGFEVAVPLDRAGGIAMVGRDGATLQDQWRSGMRSLHGMFTRGLPNLCLIGGVRQAAFSWNVTYNLKLQADHFAKIIKRCEDEKTRVFEVREDAEREWLNELDRKSTTDVRFLAECTPGYLNNEGADVDTGLASQGYGAGVLAYREQLERWRAAPLEKDFELTK